MPWKETIVMNARMKRSKTHLSKAYANQHAGHKEVDDNILEMNFMDYQLGFLMNSAESLPQKMVWAD